MNRWEIREKCWLNVLDTLGKSLVIALVSFGEYMRIDIEYSRNCTRMCGRCLGDAREIIWDVYGCLGKRREMLNIDWGNDWEVLRYRFEMLGKGSGIDSVFIWKCGRCRWPELYAECVENVCKYWEMVGAALEMIGK